MRVEITLWRAARKGGFSFGTAIEKGKNDIIRIDD